MKKLIGLVVAMLATMVFGAATPVYTDDGKTMTVTVAEGAEDTLDIAIPSTVTNFVKEGAGKLSLTTAAAWTAASSEAQVKAGTLAICTYSFLGAPKTVTVSDGATLDFTGFAANLYKTSSSYNSTTFIVSGNGYNGAGAMRYMSNGDTVKQQALLKYVRMVGDTKVVGYTHTNSTGAVEGHSCNQGWGIGQGGNTPTLNMNGHTLTIEGSFTIGNSAAAAKVNVTNPGNIVLLDYARLLMPSMNNLVLNPSPNGSKTLTMGNKTLIQTYMLRESPTMTWKLVVPKGNTAYYYSVPNSDQTRGYIYMPCEINGTLYVEREGGNAFPITFLKPITGSGTLNHYTLASAYKTIPTYIKNSMDLGELLVTRGPVEICNKVHASVTNKYVTSSTLYGKASTRIGSEEIDDYIARLNLTDGAHFDGGTDGEIYEHAIMVGIDKFGILDVSGGATVSNLIYVARQNGDYGAVYLSGDKSEIYWNSTQENRSILGDVGYGCMMMSGGKATIAGKTLLLGRNGGSGYWYQTNGTTVAEQAFWLGRPNGSSGSTADLHLSGGTLISEAGITVLNPDEGYEWRNCRAVMTVGGGTLPATLTTGNIVIYSTTNLNGSVAMFNINSNGTLVANKMYRAVANKAPSILTADYSPTRVYMNFNGGKLKFKNDQSEFFGSEKQAPTLVLVYEGGAIFDTDGHDVGFLSALQKPTGKGIASISLPTSMDSLGYRYVGVSRVVGYGEQTGDLISGLTEFNMSTRMATGINLTCPGNNLTENSVAYLLTQMRNPKACVITLEDLAQTGGVTKKGAGTLTLKGANTYGGTTRVEAGTMVFTNANGYPGGDLEIPASAILADNGTFVKAANFALNSGKKIRITGVDTATISAANGTLVESDAAMDSSIVSAIEMTDENGEVVESENIRFYLTSGGTKLTVGPKSGLSVIFY